MSISLVILTNLKKKPKNLLFDGVLKVFFWGYFWAFSDLVPAAAVTDNGDLAGVCQRQGLVPDFRLHLPNPHGEVPDDYLAELKVISAGPSRYYTCGRKDKAVDVRARTLQREYKGKLAALDSK